MQIVIDLPDDVYSVIVKQYRKDKELQTRDNLYKAIANGTPLPKGHGRLIDADAIKIDYYGEWNGLCVTEDTYKKSTIKNAATIIKADQESDVE